VTTTGDELLALDDIVKDYPGVRALDHVSLSLARGEVHGLVGENGAGKSTLIKVLAGVVAKDGGQVRLAGRPVEIRSAQDAARLGLAFVHQELNLIPYFDAAENIFLGRSYPKTRLGSIDRRALRRRAAAILEELGAAMPVDVPVSQLSLGQQTMLSVARGLAADASLVVLDEPTASLTDHEIRRLFTAIRMLAARGVAVLYVSHRLGEIFDLARRVTVMRNGRVVATRPVHEYDEAALVQMMTGRTLETVFPTRIPHMGEPLLTVTGLRGAFTRDISFTLHRGEILGIAGLVGAGRSELLHMLFGAAPVTAGECWLHGRGPLQLRSPGEAVAAGLALVPEERRSQALLLRRPVFENVTLSHLARYARGGALLDRRREWAVTDRLSRRLALRARSPRQPVGQLSGGNQQKVVFARCLAGEAQVLLLDEPARGIDVGAKQELYQLIRQLAAQGVGILLVSSELPELLGLADRLLVLREGRQVALLDAGEVDGKKMDGKRLDGKRLDEETVLRYCYGVQPQDT
jgi:ribose transport system ATP-binding protein